VKAAACRALGLLCFAVVVLAALAGAALRCEAVFVALLTLAECVAPRDLLKVCFPDLWAEEYLPCRPLIAREGAAAAGAGAASSTADQSPSVVSAVLADMGVLSLVK
jgi:hypothetical protein